MASAGTPSTATPDDRGRIALGSGRSLADLYRIDDFTDGTILLTPAELLPSTLVDLARTDPDGFAAVMRGLEDLEAGLIVDRDGKPA